MSVKKQYDLLLKRNYFLRSKRSSIYNLRNQNLLTNKNKDVYKETSKICDNFTASRPWF